MATMVVEPPMPISRPADPEAWRAVASRDARYDGRFVYAVRSTRIYCRPSCPSRRPLRENVSFFDHPDDAEQAGYRACRRCDPRADVRRIRGAQAIERARDYLDAHTDRAVSLAELAAHAGVSTSHLQRSFKRIVGLSPKEYQDAHRVQNFKSRLRAGDTVSRATYEAGFGSSSRVYERTDALLGHDAGVVPSRRTRRANSATRSPTRRSGACSWERPTVACAPSSWARRTPTSSGRCAPIFRMRRSSGATTRRTAGCAPFSSAFAIRTTRADTTSRSTSTVRRSSGSSGRRCRRSRAASAEPIARSPQAIGRPTATRAVARACATNRVAIVIPCHRVVREDGNLAGYKWGVDRKRKLLDEEAG